MTSRTVVISGFIVLVAAGAVLLVVSWLRPDRLARSSAALRHVTRPASLRILVLFVWAWLGWHFLAR